MHLAREGRQDLEFTFDDQHQWAGAFMLGHLCPLISRAATQNYTAGARFGRRRCLKTDPEMQHAISAGGGDDDSPSC